MRSAGTYEHPLGPKRKAYVDVKPSTSSNFFGPTNEEMIRYHDAVSEWEVVCKEMEAAEQRALFEQAPSCPELCAYWLQQVAALCFEMPCRCCYHSTCAAGAFVCCVSSPPFPKICAFDPSRSLWRHHLAELQTYWALTRLVVENLAVRPAAPWYVYKAEHSLIRPPKPPPPPDDGKCCKDCCSPSKPSGACAECDCDCTCERVLYQVNRKLRSLLATWSGMHSCHPAQCCGPCPCITWRSHPLEDDEEEEEEGEGGSEHSAPPKVAQMPSYAGSWCGQDGCLVCESPIARHMRWDREYEHARRTRTDAFYAQRAAAVEGIPLGAPMAGPGRTAAGDGALRGGDAKEEAAMDEHPYMEMRDGAVGVGMPLKAEADTHLSEKIQGRCATALLFGCCCAGCIVVTHGCGGVL